MPKITRIKIGPDDFKSKSEKSHDVSHLVSANYLTTFPEDAEFIKSKFPEIFSTAKDMYWFQTSGELVAEVQETLFQESTKENNQISINPEYLDPNSAYWKNKIIRERHMDITMIGKEGIKGRKRLNEDREIDDQELIEFINSRFLPLNIPQVEIAYKANDFDFEKLEEISQNINNDLLGNYNLLKYSKLIKMYCSGELSEILEMFKNANNFKKIENIFTKNIYNCIKILANHIIYFKLDFANFTTYDYDKVSLDLYQSYFEIDKLLKCEDPVDSIYTHPTNNY